MGEVLAHAAADLQEVFGRRAVGRDILPVLEPLRDVRAERQHLFSQGRGGGQTDCAMRGAQARRERHRTTKLEEIVQCVRQAVARGALGERSDRHAAPVRLHQRARRHCDAVVEFRDREVVREVVVPVAVAVDAGRRTDRELEGRDGLLGRRLGLDAQLQERLADERVVLEREAVLDPEVHQVTKYWVAIASCVFDSSATTGSSNPAKSPRPIGASASYRRWACSLPMTRAGAVSSSGPEMVPRYSRTTEAPSRSERGEGAWN